MINGIILEALKTFVGLIEIIFGMLFASREFQIFHHPMDSGFLLNSGKWLHDELAKSVPPQQKQLVRHFGGADDMPLFWAEFRGSGFDTGQ